MILNDDDTENYSIDIDMMTLPENDDTENYKLDKYFVVEDNEGR